MEGRKEEMEGGVRRDRRYGACEADGGKKKEKEGRK